MMTLEKKINETLAEKLNGKYWESSNGTKKRIYLNDRDTMMELIGLEVQFFKTGNPYAAWLDGEQISNSIARDYLYQMRENIYVDCDTLNVDAGGYGYKGDISLIRGRLEKAVKKLADEAKKTAEQDFDANFPDAYEEVNKKTAAIVMRENVARIIDRQQNYYLPLKKSAVTVKDDPDHPKHPHVLVEAVKMYDKADSHGFVPVYQMEYSISLTQKQKHANGDLTDDDLLRDPRDWPIYTYNDVELTGFVISLTDGTLKRVNS